MSKKIVFICGNGDTLIRFRLELIKRFIELDYEVHAFAPEISLNFHQDLTNLGVQFHSIKFQRKSVGLINTFISIYDIVLKLRSIKPNIIFSYTHKSVVVGSICAWIAGIRNSYSLITGTGHIFDKDTLKRKISRILGVWGFKFSLSKNKKIFFQNPDDLNLFIDLKIVNQQNTVLVNGSGVDLELFKVTPLPKDPIFICLSRLIKSKGLIEYAKAAALVRDFHPIPKKAFHKAVFMCCSHIMKGPPEVFLRQWQWAEPLSQLMFQGAGRQFRRKKMVS